MKSLVLDFTHIKLPRYVSRRASPVKNTARSRGGINALTFLSRSPSCQNYVSPYLGNCMDKWPRHLVPDLPSRRGGLSGLLDEMFEKMIEGKSRKVQERLRKEHYRDHSEDWKKGRHGELSCTYTYHPTKVHSLEAYARHYVLHTGDSFENGGGYSLHASLAVAQKYQPGRCLVTNVAHHTLGPEQVFVSRKTHDRMMRKKDKSLLISYETFSKTRVE